MKDSGNQSNAKKSSPRLIRQFKRKDSDDGNNQLIWPHQQDVDLDKVDVEIEEFTRPNQVSPFDDSPYINYINAVNIPVPIIPKSKSKGKAKERRYRLPEAL